MQATAAHLGVFGRALRGEAALAAGLVHELTEPDGLLGAAAAMTAHLGADPALARALKADLRRTVTDQSAWDRAIESERARQMWSLARTKES